MGIRKVVGTLSRKGVVFAETCLHLRSRPKTSIDDSDRLALTSNSKDEYLSYKTNEKTTGMQRKKKLYIAVLMGLMLIVLTIACSLMKPFSGADSPQCRPIFMYPSYARIDGFDIRYTKLAKKYHLYLYREQGKDRDPTDHDTISLDGVPVLFIPGNAGSYKQARSIAAASANLFFDQRSDIDNSQTQNLDFFTADFNEDFTAFHGRTMLDQAEYLNDAIRYILSLYEGRGEEMGHPIPKSVIIVGHSMGGVVARIMPTLKNHLPESVNAILTLSAPHAIAPATFDGDIIKIYREISRFWRSSFAENSSFYSLNVTLMSITGGVLDTVLPADYTVIEDIIPYTNGFTTYTTTIPQVWTPIDHLAIVWCDQLRYVIAQLLLEMVDRSSNSKTYPVKERMRLARRFLLSKLEDYAVQDLDIFTKPNTSSASIGFPEGAVEVAADTKLIVTKETAGTVPRFNIHKIPDKAEELRFALLTSLKDFQIYFCQGSLIKMNMGSELNEPEMKCITAMNDLAIVPRSTMAIKHASDSSLGEQEQPFRMLNINRTVLSEYDYILVDVPQTSMGGDDFLISELTTIELTKTINDSPLKVLLTGTNLSNANSGLSPFVSTVRLPNLWSSLVSYSLDVRFKPENLVFQPFVKQSVEWPFETKWLVNLKDNSQDINFHNVAPFVPMEVTHDKSLKLTFINPPDTLVEYYLSINWPLTLKMLLIRYRLTIAAFTTGFVSLVLAYQFWLYNDTGYFVSFDHAMIDIMNKYWQVLFFLLSVFTPLSSLHVIKQLLFAFGLSNNGVQSDVPATTSASFLGVRELFMWWLGPFFLTMTITVVFVLYKLISLIECAASVLGRKMKSEFTLTEVTDRPPHSGKMSQMIIGSVHARHCLGVILLFLSVLFYMPYQFAFVVISIVQIIVCIKLSISSRGGREFSNLKNYNNSLLMLILFIIPINAPIIVVFIHNVAIRWETPFRSHHNCLAVLPIILLVESNAISRTPLRFSNKSFTGVVTVGSLLVFSAYSFVYGTRNLFWLHHLFNIFLFVALILHFCITNTFGIVI